MDPTLHQDAEPPYANLTPECVLDAIDSVGVRCDGRLLALNSYENRVYQVWLEEGPPVVAKFYRPDRWTDAQILEEHAFACELAEREIPVVAPIVYADGRTLHQSGGFRFAVYPRRGGRAPELEDPQTLEWLGRFIGRIHALGRTRPFVHRPTLDVQSFGIEPRDYLMAHDFLPLELREVYRSVVDQALEAVQKSFAAVASVKHLRLHGDCHAGNLLWTEEGPHFVDFDDSRMGPAVQDLWMLLSGEREAMKLELAALLRGYEQFDDFDYRELQLIEPLRTLRLIHYAAWIARRWNDPAFPVAFPWFDSPRYWQDRILELREQIALMNEPPLALRS
ncbi:MAG TPA: serine/threonine protein kinase [Burkholderiales bacterium]